MPENINCNSKKKKKSREMRSFSEEMRKLANFLKPVIHRKQEENKNWRQCNNLRKQCWQRN